MPRTTTPTKRWEGAEIWKVSRLKPYDKNTRTHPPDQVKLLARLLQKHGPDQPIVVDEDGVILKGHGRRLAAMEAQIAEFPVFIRRGLSENEKRELRIADNQVALLSGWDEALMREEIGLLKVADVDLSILGFNDSQLAKFLDSTPGMVSADAIPPIPKNPIVRLGDLWILGRHRLLCGDSTNKVDVEQALGGKKPNLMVTDPPYGVKYNPLWREGLGRSVDGSVQRVKSGKTINKFRANAIGAVKNDDRADWTETWRLFPGDVAYVWHGGLHAGVVETSLATAGFVIRAQIIWNKQNQVFSRGDYHWKHEPCWYAVRDGRPGRWTGDRKQTTVWDIANHNPMGGNKNEEQTGHGTQKPVECMLRPIQNNSSPGDFVYEPFAGSGTTLIAAETSARSCIAIELDPAYCEMIIARWQKFTGLVATLGGEGYAAVAAKRQRERPAKAIKKGKATDANRPRAAAPVAARARARRSGAQPPAEAPAS